MVSAMWNALRLDRDAREARRLAQAGRFHDAVALGQAAYLRGVDSTLACDLRDWRHRAFYEGPRPQSGRPDWPPESANPRPDLAGQIPEIQAADLNANVLGGALHHHGALIVRNLLTRSQAAEKVRLIDEAFEARAQKRLGDTFSPIVPANGHDLSDERDFDSGVGFTVLTADAPKFLAHWLDELESIGVFKTVGDYLGERPVLSTNKATLYRLPHNPGSSWHQDGAFLGDGIRVVNLWVACTECGVDAPGLDIVPWRLNEIVPTGTHGTWFNWSVGDGLVDEMLGGKPMSTPHFMPGDAILFDQLCLHRTGVRPGMTRGRYAIETWMFSPAHYHSGVPLII